MSSLKEMKGEHVHTRSIRIETYSVDDGKVIVEGILEDTRAQPMYSIAGYLRKPGPVHGMVVRFLVGDVPGKILDVEVKMPTIPDDDCANACADMKKLIGMQVVYGFSKNVKKLFGGTKGCQHLTSLILTMGAAIVQGTAAHRNKKPMPLVARQLSLQYVKNTCWAWREEGPFFAKTMAEIEDASD